MHYSSMVALVLAAGAAATGCSPAPLQPPPQASATNGHPASTPRSPAASAVTRPSTCPGQRFDAFVQAFVDDVAVQKAYTADPLRMQTIDATAEPEPAPVVQSLRASQIRFPVVPDVAQREQRRLRLSVDEARTTMKLAAPDSDDQTTYRFRKGACWTLVSIESDAL